MIKHSKYQWHKYTYELCHKENIIFVYAKTKVQIICAADQHLCFHFINSIIPLLKLESSFCGRTERFESDLVDYPKDRFSYDATQFRSSSKNQK